MRNPLRPPAGRAREPQGVARKIADTAAKIHLDRRARDAHAEAWLAATIAADVFDPQSVQVWKRDDIGPAFEAARALLPLRAGHYSPDPVPHLVNRYGGKLIAWRIAVELGAIRAVSGFAIPLFQADDLRRIADGRSKAKALDNWTDAPRPVRAAFILRHLSAHLQGRRV
jgi:hypothetical protein